MSVKRDSRDTSSGRWNREGPTSQGSEKLQDGHKDKGLPQGLPVPGWSCSYLLFHLQNKRWLGQFVCLRQIHQPHPFSLLGRDTGHIALPELLFPLMHVSALLAALMSGVLPRFPEARLFDDPAPETVSCGGPGQPLPHCLCPYDLALCLVGMQHVSSTSSWSGLACVSSSIWQSCILFVATCFLSPINTHNGGVTTCTWPVVLLAIDKDTRGHSLCLTFYRSIY